MEWCESKECEPIVQAIAELYRRRLRPSMLMYGRAAASTVRSALPLFLRTHQFLCLQKPCQLLDDILKIHFFLFFFWKPIKDHLSHKR
jgi:hypothetical protein